VLPTAHSPIFGRNRLTACDDILAAILAAAGQDKCTNKSSCSNVSDRTTNGRRRQPTEGRAYRIDLGHLGNNKASSRGKFNYTFDNLARFIGGFIDALGDYDRWVTASRWCIQSA
jgi:hypothetical protein